MEFAEALPGFDKNLPIMMKYDGIYDLDALYQRIYRFFVEQGYRFHEEAHKGKSDELEIKLTPYKKVTSYVMFTITVTMHFLETKDIEVIKDGEKKKLTKGRIRVELKFDCKTDWQERFKGPFLEKLKNFYENFIFKKDFETVYVDQVYYHVLKLQGHIKEYLDSETATNAYYGVW